MSDHLLATLHRHQRALSAHDAANERRLAALYRSAVAPVQAELDRLASKIERWQREHPGEEVPRAWLYQEGRLLALLALMQQQADAYAAQAEALTTGQARDAAQTGANDGLALLAATKPAGVSWTFGRPSLAALSALQGMPLRTLFAGWGHRTSGAALRLLFADLALGRNPRVMARDLTHLLGSMTYSRALTISRTTVIRAYGAGSLAAYRANDDVVESWVWVADLSPRTCAACLAMNGSVHPLSEELHDHPNGRCAKLPRTRSWGDILGPLGIDSSDIPDTRPSIPSGAGWFRRELSAAQQRAILGPGKYRLWRSGRVSLDDLVGVDSDPLWGRSIYQLPLRSVVAASA